MRQSLLLRSLPVIGAAAIAAFLFLWQLGSSSFFLDEVSSIKLAGLPLSDLLPRLRVAENSPGGYFTLLHAWTNVVDSNAEWVVRLPSVLAGIALVAAVWWLARLVAGEGAAAVAALLVAVSPLVLQYAQQARTYTLAMLVLTLIAIAAIEANRRQSWRWAVAGAAGSVAALSLQYASLAVIAPLCLWFLSRRQLNLRMRVIFCALPALAWLAWLPLAWSQHKHHPHEDLGADGTLKFDHAVRVLGAPFDDRYTTSVGGLKVIAALMIVALVTAAAFRIKREAAEMKLMLGLVLLPPIALFAAAIVGVQILNSRYMTFAVPFLLVIVGAVVARAALPVAVGIVSVLLAIAIVGDIGSHSKKGFYPDTRGVVAAIDHGWKRGDVLLDRGTLGVHFPLVYYAENRLPHGAPVFYVADPAARPVLATRPRLWVVQQGASAAPPDGYRTVSERHFPAAVDLTLALLEPRG